MTALLPCPFCGDPAKVGEWATHYVKCSGCDVRVIGLTEAEAVASWNTRAAPASPSEAHDEGPGKPNPDESAA